MNRKYILFLLLALFFKTAYSQNKTTEGNVEVEKVLLEFKKQYAPDARTVYFQYLENDDQSYVVETTAKELTDYLAKEERKTGKKLPVTINFLPDANLQDKVYGVINLSVANLRTKPSHSAEMATQALLGTPVDILKRASGFFLIRTPDNYLSWVDRYGVALMSKTEVEDWQKSKRLIFIKDFGYAFQGTDENTARISDMVLGDIVKAGTQKDGFQEIIFPDGRRAFASIGHFEDFEQWKQRTKPEADKIIETAKTMIGVPYLWGGTSIKGVDCSGFTKTAFFMNGLVLPRDASQQITKGVALNIMKDGDLDVEKAKKELKKGDLIFFSASKTSNPKQPITHVAIYMDHGEFIHAAGRVRINSFDPSASNYDSQSETIVAAHRYLGDVGDNFVPTISATPRY